MTLAFAILVIFVLLRPSAGDRQPDFVDVYCKALEGPILDCIKKRPDFQPGVEVLFKGAQNTAEWNGQLDLCHVISWKTIQTEFLKYSPSNPNGKGFFQRMMEGDDKARKKAIEDMNTFLDLLFEVDKEAVAPHISNDGKWNKVKHVNIIKWRNSKATIHKSLEDINNNLKQVAKKLSNANHFNPKKDDLTKGDTKAIIKNCGFIMTALSAMNSAPANLRYGDSKINRQISDFTDPMGNSKGLATSRENRFIWCYKSCLERTNKLCESSTGTYIDQNDNPVDWRVKKGTKRPRC